MPIPSKPCLASFSDEVVAALEANRNRERWATFPCQQCGQQVGAVMEKGKWVPETHWPSVSYTPRTRRVENRLSR